MTDITYKLFIKNIPDNIPEEKFLDVLKKNFEDLSNILIYKTAHKFSSKNNKVCSLSTNSKETRQKLFDFFATFDMIDNKGLKNRLKLNDVVYPKVVKNITDPLNNSFAKLDHYQKFVEYFNSGKTIEFKFDEEKYSEGIFEGVVLPQKEEKAEKAEKPKEISKGNQKDANGRKVILTKGEKKADLNEQQSNNKKDIKEVEEVVEVSAQNNNGNYNNQSNNNYYYGKKNGKYANNKYNVKQDGYSENSYGYDNYNNGYSKGYGNSYNNYENEGNNNNQDGYYNNNGYSNYGYQNKNKKYKK